MALRRSNGRSVVRVVHPPALRFARTRGRNAPKVEPSSNIGRATRAIGPPANSSSPPDGDSLQRCAWPSNACPMVWPGVAENIKFFRNVLRSAGSDIRQSRAANRHWNRSRNRTFSRPCEGRAPLSRLAEWLHGIQAFATLSALKQDDLSLGSPSCSSGRTVQSCGPRASKRRSRSARGSRHRKGAVVESYSRDDHADGDRRQDAPDAVGGVDNAPVRPIASLGAVSAITVQPKAPNPFANAVGEAEPTWAKVDGNLHLN